MGVRDWFSKKQEPRDSRELRPAATGPALDAITELLKRDREDADGESWVTFTARSGDAEAVIEVADDSVNFCLHEIDLPALMREIGLTALADTARPGGDETPDRTLWMLPGALPEELAAIVDAAFTHRLGMEPGYRVWGERQGSS